MEATRECALPEVYAVLLQRLRSRLTEASRVTVPGTHATTQVTARMGAGSAFAPSIVLCFAHAPEQGEPARVFLSFGKDGRLRQCDADGDAVETVTVTATRSLIGNKTYLHLHGLAWRRMETHDVSQYVTLRELPSLPDRTHKVQDLPQALAEAKGPLTLARRI